MPIALILAAGMGQRMQTNIPKQYISLMDKPMLVHSLQRFDVNEGISAITVVCHESWHNQLKQWLDDYAIRKVKTIVPGGDTRRDSSYLGLKSVASYAKVDEIVLIHDAARPFISQAIIDANIKTAEVHGACCTAMAVSDTILQSEDGQTIHSIPPRSRMYASQTPQTFHLKDILAAHEHHFQHANDTEITDDCALALAQNIPIALVEGTRLNGKATTREDIAILELLIQDELL